MGGAVAEISDFPYAVSIKKHGEHHCGGSLVRFEDIRYFQLVSIQSAIMTFFKTLFQLFRFGIFKIKIERLANKS